MLKKITAMIIIISFVMSYSVFTGLDTGSDVALAGNTVQYGVSAVMPQWLEINAILKTVDLDPLSGIYDINWNSNPASVDFGTLVPVTGPQGQFYYMTGTTAYAVIMYPATSGRAYKLNETGTNLTSAGGNTIVPEAYVMTHDYQWLDTIGSQQQGQMPAGASLAFPQSTVGNNKLVYTSDAAGTTKAIRSFLAITGPDTNGNIMNYSQGHNGAAGQGTAQYYQGNGQNNWLPVTMNQAAGTYTGSVTFTLNLA